SLFSRWFIEWGENFCIRREQELKQLKEICEKGICNGTDETKKKECKMLCESYKQFLSNSKTQYENQKKEYEYLKPLIPEFKNKKAIEFLKEKCKPKCSCFDNKTEISVLKMFEHPPDDVKDECECKTSKEHDDKVNDLDKCPTEENNNICNKYRTPRRCGDVKYTNSLEHWYGRDMLIPRRRRKMCLRNIIGRNYYKRKDGKNKFKNDLLYAASSEASFLCNNYEDKKEALQAIKYTFADIGDIVKGKDMVDEIIFKDIKGKLEKVLDSSKNDPKNASDWWEQNKKHVWNAMLCGYKEAGGKIESNDCNIPSEENTDQFLRWLIEWGKQVCKEKKELKASVYKKCANKDRKSDKSCNYAAFSFNNWNKIVKHAYDGLNKKYENFKLSQSGSTLTQKDAAEYIKESCSECECSFEDIEETFTKNSDPNDEVLDVIINKSHIPPHLEDIFNRYNGPYLHCPDSTLCSPYKNIACIGRIHNDDGDWESTFVKDNKRTNIGVLLPPRRRHLCLRIELKNFVQLRKEINNFKDFIFSSAFAEAKRLKQVYNDNSKVVHAMKYSFADIGNIVKGDDMMESPTSTYMEELFNKKYIGTDRKTWWDLNKYHVWESMLCGYTKAVGNTQTNLNCRFPDIESVPEFLRWFQEWTENFCIQRKKLYDIMVANCKKAKCDENTGKVDSRECAKACRVYEDYVLIKKKEYDFQKKQYDFKFKIQYNSKEAHDYLKEKCKDGICGCLHEKFNSYTNWEKPYETLDDSELKNKCDCKKIVPPPPKPSSPEVLPSTPSDEPFNRDILEKTIPFGVA
ncbi:hypothetical protein PFNF135_03791, partial [Plasmodium falciparum NF135/5.C10]